MNYFFTFPFWRLNSPKPFYWQILTGVNSSLRFVDSCSLCHSLCQWSFLRTCWKKDSKPVTLPCWVWVTSSFQVSSLLCCCASMWGNARLFIFCFYFQRSYLSLSSLTLRRIWGKQRFWLVPLSLQPEEKQQDIFLLQFSGLHLWTGTYHLRHAHLQTCTGEVAGQCRSLHPR